MLNHLALKVGEQTENLNFRNIPLAIINYQNGEHDL